MTTQDNTTQFDSLTTGDLSKLLLEVVSVLIKKNGSDENRALLVSAIETVSKAHGIGVKLTV